MQQSASDATVEFPSPPSGITTRRVNRPDPAPCVFDDPATNDIDCEPSAGSLDPYIAHCAGGGPDAANPSGLTRPSTGAEPTPPASPGGSEDSDGTAAARRPTTRPPRSDGASSSSPRTAGCTADATAPVGGPCRRQDGTDPRRRPGRSAPHSGRSTPTPPSPPPTTASGPGHAPPRSRGPGGTRRGTAPPSSERDARPPAAGRRRSSGAASSSPAACTARRGEFGRASRHVPTFWRSGGENADWAGP